MNLRMDFFFFFCKKRIEIFLSIGVIYKVIKVKLKPCSPKFEEMSV